MIVVFCKYGNHSNRLLQNLHFEAMCYEHNVRYINPTFYDMKMYYKSPCSTENTVKSFFMGNAYVRKVMKVVLGGNILSFDDPKEQHNLDFFSKNKKMYVCGWYCRNYDLTKKHQDLFIHKYSLKDIFYRENNLINKIERFKEEGCILVGVHVRRGDYKEWEGGKYYFNDDVYIKYIESLRKSIVNLYGRKCIVVVFSNENVDFCVHDEMLISKNEWYIDHHAMSKCDFLLGPPSTFTLWASYIGKTKYWHITDPSRDVLLDDFSYCTG